MSSVTRFQLLLLPSLIASLNLRRDELNFLGEDTAGSYAPMDDFYEKPEGFIHTYQNKPEHYFTNGCNLNKDTASSINLRWYCSSFIKDPNNRVPNVGDALNEFLLPALASVPHLSRCIDPSVEKYMAIGSLMHRIDSNSILWGVGAIQAGQTFVHPKRVYAVRGPLTRAELLRNGISCPKVYGDPAILYPRVYSPSRNVTDKYEICVVPHYADYTVPWVQNFSEKPKAGYKFRIVDVRTDPETFVDALVSCNFVASSSLHGLILSDAYGVPNKWIEFSHNVNGDGFKYRDYFQGVGREDTGTKKFVVTHHFVEKLISLKPKDYSVDLAPVQEKLLAACPFCKKHKDNGEGVGR